MPHAPGPEARCGAGKPDRRRRDRPRGLAGSLALALASTSLVACGPSFDPCLYDIYAKTGIPTDEPIDWTVTLCLDDACSTLLVHSDGVLWPDVSGLRPDATGSLFEYLHALGGLGWELGAAVSSSERTGEMRVSFEVRDRPSGELVLHAAVNHAWDDDECIALRVSVDAPPDDASP